MPGMGGGLGPITVGAGAGRIDIGGAAEPGRPGVIVGDGWGLWLGIRAPGGTGWTSSSAFGFLTGFGAEDEAEAVASPIGTSGGSGIAAFAAAAACLSLSRLAAAATRFLSASAALLAILVASFCAAMAASFAIMSASFRGPKNTGGPGGFFVPDFFLGGAAGATGPTARAGPAVEDDAGVAVGADPGGGKGPGANTGTFGGRGPGVGRGIS